MVWYGMHNDGDTQSRLLYKKLAQLASNFDASCKTETLETFPRWHHNNNNLRALHKATFVLPLTSPLQVSCFGVLMQMNRPNMLPFYNCF